MDHSEIIPQVPLRQHVRIVKQKLGRFLSLMSNGQKFINYSFLYFRNPTRFSWSSRTKFYFFGIQFENVISGFSFPGLNRFLVLKIRNRKFAWILNSSFGTESEWNDDVYFLGMGQDVCWTLENNWITRKNKICLHNKATLVPFNFHYMSSCATSFNYSSYQFWGFSKFSNLLYLNYFEDWPFCLPAPLPFPVFLQN